MSSPARCRGVTLIELIVTIVVVAIAVSGVLALVSATAARSAENMEQVQAVAIAESYLNEILQKPFGVDCALCSRTQLDKVGDYNGLVDVGAHDATGAAVANLGSYTVRVTVANSALGTAPQVLAAQSELVTVTVTSPDGQAVALGGYRTSYP
ncbi:MAG TPA: prepilin-type N-terminal cleavage/methylation domain-containing protein [Steroidobacteraceae bacterium]|jgi:MSHA pilin protein MshD|nr:prepilin-type N-terminal cleavage/methylation domain-containing protein [Steroidobacteraceae bacterium]